MEKQEIVGIQMYQQTDKPYYHQLQQELLKTVGLTHEGVSTGDYKYDLANVVTIVGNEAIVDVGDQIRATKKIVFPTDVISEISMRGGMRAVVLEYSQRRLNELIAEWDEEMFDTKPGEGNTDYEKVISLLETSQ